MMKKIFNKIKKTNQLKPFCIAAIDGCGGSGKSTLAEYIGSKSGGTQIIHMDDFYKPFCKRVASKVCEKKVAADYDIKRLNKDVIDVILNGKESKYQRYDWVLDVLCESHIVHPNGLIIVEGVYSLCDELYSKYDIKIFVECNRKLRLMRGLQRDGENALDFWKKWMIDEDKYLHEQQPQARADFIISGEEKY